MNGPELKKEKDKKPKIWTSKKADRIFSIWIRQRDPFCFFKCGRKSIQNSHFWGRGISATRYDPENCDGVCGGCHMTHEGSKQGKYRDLKMKQLGKRYRELEKRGRSSIQRSKAIEEAMKLLTLNQ